MLSYTEMDENFSVRLIKLQVNFTKFLKQNGHIGTQTLWVILRYVDIVDIYVTAGRLLE